MSHDISPMNGLYDAEYFDIKSQHVDDIFRIFVGKPAGADPAIQHPMIVALDGNASFASLLGTQRLLTQTSAVPASFVIGIGYPGDTLMESMANRNRDYAPTDPGENEVMALGGLFPAGGEAFLKFIQLELKTLLSKNYPIDTDDSTILGISLGGLFAAWILLTEPTTFKRYILASPAIWWRDEQVWEWEETYAASHDDLEATVFVAAGALELKQHVRAEAVAIAEKNPQMRTHVENMISRSDEHGWPEIALLTPQFASRLQGRNYPGLKIHCHNMPDETHMSAPPSITSRGLRYVHGSWES